MKHILKITTGADGGKTWLLHPGENLLGRSRTAHIRVPNDDVSGKQCLIIINPDDGSAMLKNLSTRGTKLDGKLISDTSELTLQQIISAGKDLEFVFTTEADDEVEQDEISSNKTEHGEEENSDATSYTCFFGNEPASEKDNTDSFKTSPGEGNHTPATRMAQGFEKISSDSEPTSSEQGATHSEMFDKNSDDTHADTTGGALFMDDDIDKTNVNETHMVQTRMANMDEINFIKGQIKKQQQNRFYMKFILFALVAGLLLVVWKLRAPQHERVVSWPRNAEGAFNTGFISPFDNGTQQGGFDMYYPLWDIPGYTEVDTSVPDTVIIKTFLGKRADVRLNITLTKEKSESFIHEKRADALENALVRLAASGDGLYNIDRNYRREFLVPPFGDSENGLVCDIVTYQRELDGHAWAGVLRFFRNADTLYMIRSEVPAEEKHRAIGILVSDSFINISHAFIRKHWEGSDDYPKNDMNRQMIWVRNELNRKAPMQMPRLEIAVKALLAQALSENNEKAYKDAMALLLTLRRYQQEWYKMQRLKWFAATRERNSTKRMKIRSESEAVFTIKEDKRNYDILRDNWE